MTTQPPPSVANNFVDPKTAMSMPIACSVISTGWHVAERLFEGALANAWIPVGMTVVFGIALYAISDSRGKSIKEKIPSAFSAFANTTLVLAAVLGISSAVPATG